ncbi:MAG: DUF642 domain-containing protein [Microcystaceae cyanobacterium]
MKTQKISQLITNIAGLTMLGTLVTNTQPVQAVNLIQNGSFETGNFSGNFASNIMILNAGANNITGWTVINSDLGWLDGPTSFNIPPSDGNRSFDLTGLDSLPFGGVTQTVTTEIGQEYNLMFDLGGTTGFGSPVAITASADNISETFFRNNLQSVSTWETFTLNFTATDIETTISLIGSTGRSYIGLDNVVLEESDSVSVPESSNLLGLFLVGGVILFMVSSSRRKKTLIPKKIPNA